MATLFLFPSVTETQGVVLSEAQSFGLPCIVTDGGGASESVRNNVDALVVPPQIGYYVTAIETLLADTERRHSFAEAARNSPLRPTPEQMAERIISIYRENP